MFKFNATLDIRVEEVSDGFIVTVRKREGGTVKHIATSLAEARSDLLSAIDGMIPGGSP